MKKTYITPEALTTELGTCGKMMIESLPIGDGTNPGDEVGEGDFLTKEHTGKNIWDEEW